MRFWHVGTNFSIRGSDLRSMRKSTVIAGPLFLIGIDGLLQDVDQFEAVQAADVAQLTPHTMVRLAIAMFGTLLLMVPVSWVYFITTRVKDIDRSFAQTMMVLPIIVAGIAMIVQNSVALAFSLAGIVAAVRFRLTLGNPSDALYVFSAIAIGLGAGISALGISAVISIGFVYTHLLLWKLDYGENLNTSFFSFLTGRGHSDGDDD